MNLKGKGFIITTLVIGITVPIIYQNYYYYLLIIPLLLLLTREQRQLLPILLVTCLFTFLYVSYIESQHKTSIPADVNVLNGKITSIPKLDGDYLSFQFTLHNKETVKVTYYSKNKQQKERLTTLQYGMICEIQGELKKPQSRRNFNGFDYREYLSSNNIYWLFTANDFDVYQCESSKGFLSSFYHFKQNQINLIKDHLNSYSEGFVIALVFGDNSDIDPNLIDAYLRQGLIHLLAISGLHVGLLVGMLYYLLIRTGITREWTATCIIILLPSYILLTGASPSIVRAGGMTILFLLVYRFRIRLHPLDIISIICILQVLLNPYIVKDLGFQFSYLTSYALIISSRTLLQSFQSPLILTLKVTTIAQIVSLPLVLYYNFEISIFALLLNIIFIPLISFLILPLCLITVLSINISEFLSFPIGGLLEFLLYYSNYILKTVDNWHFGILVLGKPNTLIILFMYSSIIYLFTTLERKRSTLIPIVLVLFLLIFQGIYPYMLSDTKVTFIDVGQGDSILIELPHRKAVYLIDTGGVLQFAKEDWQKRSKEFDTGKDIVAPYLKSLGIKEVSALILTHGDVDHVGGAEAILNEFDVNMILYPNSPQAIHEVDDILGEHKDMQGKVQLVEDGLSWQIGKSQFRIVNPTKRKLSRNNNNSIVIVARMNGVQFLFTGDLEKEGERLLINNYRRFIHASILKVGHHGSNTSTNPPLLNAVSPHVAVISAGENNRFGHPSPNVLERLNERDIPILRTDQLGAIKIIVNKNKKYRAVNARKN